MKKLTYKNPFLFLLMILVVGCEKNLEYQLTNQAPKVLMYAFPMPDSTLKIHASYSTNILSASDSKGIENLEYNITVNGANAHSGAYPASQGWHTEPALLGKSGDSYRLEYELPNGTKISGQTTIPYPVQIMRVDTISASNTNTDGKPENMLRCTVEIIDPGATKNHYQIRVDYEETTQSDTLSSLIQTIPFIKEDKVFLVRNDESSILLTQIDLQGTFTDYLFNGKNYGIKLLIPEKYLNKTTPTQSAKLIVYLYTLTPEYYHFMRSSIEETAFKDYPVFEPLNLFSNINNGIGVVAGLSVDSVWVKLR